MNDRHPSAAPDPSVPAPDAAFGHHPSYEQYTGSGYAAGAYGPGTYDTGAWDGTSQWGAATGHTQVWDFGALDTGQHQAQQSGWGQVQDPSWSGGSGPAGQWQWDTGGWDYADTSGQWGTSGQWDTGAQWDTTGGQDAAAAAAASHAMTQTWDTSSWTMDHAAPTQTWDTSSYTAAEAPRHEEAPHDPTMLSVPLDTVDGPPAPGQEAGTRTMLAVSVPPEGTGAQDDRSGPEDEGSGGASAQGTAPAAGRVPNRRKGGAPRSGYRPRRKALLTVAVPSVAVMGVAGVAAAAVAGNGGQQDGRHAQAASAPDTASGAGVKLSAANNALDSQLAGLSRGADDFATRANRTQERIDLRLRQEEERKRKAEEAARKEAARPKFALPVNQHGLSAYYGQAGVNWMSVHTGIDFPVSYGTPVMAATDGTVRTQYNVAYGNMAIVTAPDGTETWYCHLSSTRVRSGQVKAGDVIAYSGNSGNSTGPHLHFEVRPGGSAVDPLPWLRGHDLDPT
ncbi:peptidoglycan DD-metalloendopeptidase family protein [Streptomyces caatingaensis]|uniref:M23ase beta-sheet core domain-containing protein n=1 Tax=Streptomyces caatingaensis TaxID=1678637 RepID=A0A0K9XDR2_9ACTN|nr:peptidoglycan DD-metalloendopeptidase family protein [Streptomyces caatingaensis]KNB51569.1 hypothetical protein AC230_14435 [Streptomyces caatingaensis]